MVSGIVKRQVCDLWQDLNTQNFEARGNLWRLTGADVDRKRSVT